MLYISGEWKYKSIKKIFYDINCENIWKIHQYRASHSFLQEARNSTFDLEWIYKAHSLKNHFLKMKHKFFITRVFQSHIMKICFYRDGNPTSGSLNLLFFTVKVLWKFLRQFLLSSLSITHRNIHIVNKLKMTDIKVCNSDFSARMKDTPSSLGRLLSLWGKAS